MRIDRGARNAHRQSQNVEIRPFVKSSSQKGRDEDVGRIEPPSGSVDRRSLALGKISVRWPSALRHPAVIASPHSGRDYPSAFLASTHLDMLAVRGSEDAYVEALYDWAPASGVPFLEAMFPRALVDVNRDARELDPAAYAGAPRDFAAIRSAKVAAGLGSVPTVVGPGRPIMAGKLPWAEAQARLDTHHRPYHAALEEMLGKVEAEFGGVILFDAHSMPSTGAHGHGGVDIVLGDLHGASATPAVIESALTALKAAGFGVRRNAPYAGAYTLATYGAPERGRHALQIEINRGLYLDEAAVRLREDYAEVKNALRRAILSMLDNAGPIICGRPSE